MEILFLLSDQGDGNYHGTINTSIVNEGTYEIAVTAQKEQYEPDQTSLTLIVTSNTLGGIEGTVTEHDGNPLAGMRVGVGIVSGTTFFPEIAAETNEEGYYQIGSVPPGHSRYLSTRYKEIELVLRVLLSEVEKPPS